MPRVSVILTSYNHAPYVKEAIDSVLDQTYPDLELIVLDDASSDDSWELISRYSDPRIRAVRSTAPGQVTHQLNRAIASAAGEFVAIHHSDDVWEVAKVERQVAYLDAHPGIGAVFTWAQIIDEAGDRVENHWFNQPARSRWERLNDLFNQKNTLNHPSVLIRKHCFEEIGEYHHGLYQIDDAELWSRLLLRHPIHVLEEKLTRHRRFSDNSSISGERPEVAIRAAHEWNCLRRNFLDLTDFDEVALIFPELAHWRRPNGCNIKFLLAMACVQSPHRSAWALGVEWLFDVFSDSAQREQVAALYGFTTLDFIRLSATLDSYQMEATRQHHLAIAEYEARLQGVLAEHGALQRVLAERDGMLRDAADEQARNLRRLQAEYGEAAERTVAAHLAAQAAWQARVEDLGRLLAEKDREAAASRQLAEAHGAWAAAERERAEAERRRATAESRRADIQFQLAEADRRRAEAQSVRADTEHDRADTEHQRADAEHSRAETAERDAQQQRLLAQHADVQRQAVAIRLAAVEASSSWRATAPVRKLLAGRPRTARALRRMAKLLWWSASFQLLRKSREWRERQRTAIPTAADARTESPAPAQPLTTDAPPAGSDAEASADLSAPPLVDAGRLSEWLAAAQRHLAVQHRPRLGRPLMLRYFEQLAFAPEAARAWIDLLDRLEEARRPEASAEIELAATSLESHARIDDFVASLHGSTLFDTAFYLGQLDIKGSGEDAIRHYLLIGEPLGIRPSPNFDPAYYARRHPDVPDSGLNCLFHYVHAGQREGRQASPTPVRHRAGARPMDPHKENVILAVHETSRTGAPILGWNIATRLAERYNVFSVLLGDGALTPEFEAVSCESIGPFEGVRTNPLDAEFGLAPLLARRTFKYAVVNSIESRVMVEICAVRAIPTLLLVHEYGSYVWPAAALCKALDMATEVVFPAPSVARSSLDVHPPLRQRGFHVAPQGMSLLPSGQAQAKPFPDTLLRMLTHRRAEGELIVIGAGSVNLRKGVDAFIAVAADVKRLGTARPIHFLWVGGGYRPQDDMGYSIYLKEQIARAEVQDDITFVDEVSDLEPIYAMSDLFVLASRLDPLPNVSIDAAQRGIPVICFKEASGMADLLLADQETAVGVVPYMDVRSAAEVIVRLATDDSAREHLSDATRRFATSTFDMERYVECLDGLGSMHSAGSPHSQRPR